MKSLKALGFFVAGAVMATAFTSCNKKDVTEKNSDFEFSLVSGKAAYRLEGSSVDYNRDEEIVMFDSASIVLPEKIYGRDVTALKDSIIKAAFDTVAAPVEAMNKYFEETAADYGYKITQLPATEATIAIGDGIAIVTGSVFNLTGGRLTYLVTSERLAPAGANGMTSTRFFTFDLETRDLVTLNEIFTPEGLKALPELIKGRALHLAPALGPTDITGLPADGNFYISLTNEMVFVYQPFEVASHAQGEISVPFAGYQLQDYMTPYGCQLFNLR